MLALPYKRQHKHQQPYIIVDLLVLLSKCIATFLLNCLNRPNKVETAPHRPAHRYDEDDCADSNDRVVHV